MRRARVVAGLLLALTFATGGLAGMAVEEALGLDWFDFLDEDTRRDDRLLRGIRLSGEQREEVERILDRQEDRLEEYWAARLPEMQAIADASYDEVRGVLTPEQRAVFDRRVEEQGARRAEEPGD
jgi:Spy/CpxP family protein refolding chaperone